MIKYNPNVMSAEQAKQLIEAINAFKKGETQPEGRFNITGKIDDKDAAK